MHKCPRLGCRIQVPDRMFACRRHWFKLSKPVQNAIWATAGRPLGDRERLEAVKAALEEWKDKEETE